MTTRFPIRLPAAARCAVAFCVQKNSQKFSQTVAAATVILRGLWYNTNAENFRFGFGRLRRLVDERGPRSFSIGERASIRQEAREMKFLGEKRGNLLSPVPIVSGDLRR